MYEGLLCAGAVHACFALAAQEYFWERLARVLFAECVNLCNENMRQDWGNPKLQLIWSVRDRTGSNFALIVRRGAS